MDAMNDPLRRLMTLHQQQFQSNDMTPLTPEAQQGWDEYLQTTQDEGVPASVEDQGDGTPEFGSLEALRRAAGMG